MFKYSLEIIVFICGAVVMILEIVGSRVLAPYLGTSIFVWTSLIGVILGSLSLGYWYGGKIADKQPNFKTFSIIIFLGAIFTGLISITKLPILNLAQNFHDLRIGAVLSAIILFSPPSILLGIISPYAVKLKIKNIDTSGTTVGDLYAISTVGSIIGTFAAGFFLISYFGNTKLIFILTAVLLLTSILAYPKNFSKSKACLLIFVILCLPISGLIQQYLAGQGIIDIDTKYGRVLIYDNVDLKTGRPIRKLVTNPRETQSAMFLDKGEETQVFEYTKYYRLGEHFNHGFSKSLIIGGGAYSFPKEYLNRYQSSTIDAVEIDPKFTELAKKYFNLKDNPRLNIFHEDGRTFLNKTKNKYDIVYLDAFRSFYSVPYHLTTREVVKKLYDSLNPGGVVLLNIINAVEGEKSEFLRAEYATYKTIFPQVYLIPTQDENKKTMTQNVILVAIKSDEPAELTSANPELDGYLKHLIINIPEDAPILTDDFAPVDQYIMKLM